MSSSKLSFIAKSLTIVIASFAFAGTAQLAAQTTSGTLLGTVQNKAGKGLAEIKIAVENEENGNLRATRSDDKGSYALFNLPPGTYKITASKAGFREQTIKSFPIQFNQKNVVRLPLFTLQTAALQGKIVDSLARILPNAKVMIASEDRNIIQQVFTDRNGEYSIADLAPGKYILSASWRGSRGELSGTSTIQLSAETADVRFVEVLFSGRLRGSRNEVAKQNRTTAQTTEFRQVKFARTPAGRSPVPTGLPASFRQQTPQPASVYSSGDEAAALINTTDAARSQNFSERQINSLPIGGATSMRSFDELALLMPGVAPPPYTPGVRGPGVGFGIGTAGQFSVNGMRARSNNFSVDGSDNNDPDVGMRRQGFVALVPQPIESIKEISISTLLWDTELGRNFGSQVNAVTKYGGRKYHGQLYGLFTDSRLKARNFFDTGGKTPFTRAQAGLTFSGPIIRNRTQFFLSYEHDQTRASTTEHFSTPTVEERRFQGGAALTTIFGTQSRLPDRAAIEGALPLGREVLSLYPLPNNPNGPYGANTFTTRTPADNSGTVLSLKLTHQISLSSSLSGRLSFTGDGRVLPSVNQAIRSTLDSRTRSHNFSIIFDKAIGHTVSNQARFSFGRTLLDLFEYPNNPFIFSASSFHTVYLDDAHRFIHSTGVAQTGPLGELLIEPYSPVGVNAFTFPQRRASNTFQYADSVSWSAGNHSIKFGANIRRYQLNSALDRLYRPEAVFGYGIFDNQVNHTQTLIPGVQVATLGVPSSVLQTMTLGAPDSTIGLRFTEYHGFVNDTWRIRPRLVLDYGLRYEYNTVPREVNNRIESALQLENLPPSGITLPFVYRGSTVCAVCLEPFNATLAAYRQIIDGRRRIYDPDYNNFAPRAGFAWSVDTSGKTVIRGGYGLYYDAILGAVVSQSRNVFPNEIQFNFEAGGSGANAYDFNNPTRFLAFQESLPGPFFVPPIRLLAQAPCNQFGTCNQYGLAPQYFGLALIRIAKGIAFTLPEKKLRSPYAQQWHLTAEREVSKGYLLSIAYVGTKGTKLTRLTTPNLGKDVTPRILMFPTGQVPNVQVDPAITPNRPNPNLGPYQIFENSANSIYHALQVETRKRYSHNYQFTAAYTWSHAIDDVSDLFPIAGAPVIAQDSFNFRAERGDANFDIRHRFAASLLWDLPFYRTSRSGAGRLLKNWQIASIFQANTGQPFTLNLPVDANLDGNLTDRPSTTNGLIFLKGHGPQRVVFPSGKQLTDFFSFGSNGAVGRNTARGDNLIDLDLSLSRTFRFGETKNLVFRTELFNLLNRANFGLPVRTLGAPGFGSAVDTVVPSRTIVLVVKSSF